MPRSTTCTFRLDARTRDAALARGREEGFTSLSAVVSALVAAYAAGQLATPDDNLKDGPGRDIFCHARIPVGVWETANARAKRVTETMTRRMGKGLTGVAPERSGMSTVTARLVKGFAERTINVPAPPPAPRTYPTTGRG